jgi:hypothetical protein
MNQTIELGSDCLLTTARMDLVPIESMMLWPHDAKARNSAFGAAFSVVFPEFALILDSDTLLKGIAIISSSVPISEIHRLVVNKPGPFIHGIVAGWILRETLSRSANNCPDAVLKCVLVDAAQKFAIVWPVRGEAKQLSAKTVEQASWGVFPSRTFGRLTWRSPSKHITAALSPVERYRLASSWAWPKRIAALERPRRRAAAPVSFFGPTAL